MFPRYFFSAPAALLAASLTGCASLPADWGRSQAWQSVAAQGLAVPQPADAQAYTRERLQQPLGIDSAVQLALVNNPRLRLQAAQLGYSAAEVYQAGRLANPVLSAARLSGDAVGSQLTLGISLDFSRLLFLRAESRLAGAQFEAAKLELASTALELAAEVEGAWYAAAAAQQLATLREDGARAARASARLAQRYHEAGNLPARALALEQASAAQAQLDAQAARAAAGEAHSALNLLMGLPPQQDGWTLQAGLPAPLANEPDAAALLQLAADRRLDVAAARLNAQAVAEHYRLERRLRWVGGIEIGYEREKDFDGAINHGPTLALELPLFDWGSGRAARAQALLEQREAQLDQLLLQAGNDVRRQHAAVLSAKARVETYRQQLIPQREQIVRELQLEQNYMLTSVFELLLARQQEYAARAGRIEALGDYWRARSALARAVGQRLPGGTPSPATKPV
ncbi:MAG TPA: TolC family protein, partial [Solimonas sp.]|nr:TolC family protein [Solimonas sp.]